MEKEEIRNKIFEIIDHKLKVKLDTSQVSKYRLLDPRIGFYPRDLLVLFFELQKEFHIVFEETDILDNKFDNLDTMVDIIFEKLKK